MKKLFFIFFLLTTAVCFSQNGRIGWQDLYTTPFYKNPIKVSSIFLEPRQTLASTSPDTTKSFMYAYKDTVLTIYFKGKNYLQTGGSGSGGAGNPNTNLGGGLRIAKAGTNQVYTIYPGAGFGIDSTSNSNALTFFPLPAYWKKNPNTLVTGSRSYRLPDGSEEDRLITKQEMLNNDNSDTSNGWASVENADGIGGHDINDINTNWHIGNNLIRLNQSQIYTDGSGRMYYAEKDSLPKRFGTGSVTTVGSSGNTDTTITYTADGSQTTLTIPVGWSYIATVQPISENGSGNTGSGSSGTNALAYYSIAPFGSITYKITGRR